MWRGGENNEPDLLAACYRESLTRADEVGAKQVAFPAISTGIFGYPIDAAARVAIETIGATKTQVCSVDFVTFDQANWNAYDHLLQESGG